MVGEAVLEEVGGVAMAWGEHARLLEVLLMLWDLRACFELRKKVLEGPARRGFTPVLEEITACILVANTLEDSASECILSLEK